MNSISTTWMLLLLATQAAFGQPAGSPKSAPGTPPTVTILTAATGAMIVNQGVGSSTLNLGQASYFRGASVPGESIQRAANSLIITTRFALRVDCPGSPASAQVSVTAKRMDASVSHAMSIDGMKLGPAPQILQQSMPCGSAGEHLLAVEVPKSTPSGSIGSTVAFAATLKQ
jgi:hypothetical protein